MPRKSSEMGWLQLKHLRKGTHAVGGVTGLSLRVNDENSKSWILRAVVDGRRTALGLGSFPEVSLSEARERARSKKLLIREGKNPVEEKRLAKKLLRKKNSRIKFRDAYIQFLKTREVEFRSVKHSRQWRSTMESYVLPVIGEIYVEEIEVQHVKAVLEPIWYEKTETAKRVRGRIERVLAWAAISGHRSAANPAVWKGFLDQIFPAPSKISPIKHHPALRFEELPRFFRVLQEENGVAARALEFLILTGARSGEVRNAYRSEVDFRSGMWSIPAERTKMNRSHRVPLSEQAFDSIRRSPQLADSAYLFTAVRGGALSDVALSKVLRKHYHGLTVHGFRSTFRDWVSERTSFPAEVAEMALAHKVSNSVEAAYRRGDLYQKRIELMEAWGRFCSGE